MIIFILFLLLVTNSISSTPAGNKSSAPQCDHIQFNNSETAHNFAPIIGLSISWGGTVVLDGIIVGLGAIGLKLFKDRNNTPQIQLGTTEQINSPFNSSPPDPENNQDKDPIEKLKENNSKKVRTNRFGNIYQDSETGLWWSRDKAKHGGSEFKVFKETSKGLQWVFDADKAGRPIVAKHKGPIGFFVSKKDIIA